VKKTDPVDFSRLRLGAEQRGEEQEGHDAESDADHSITRSARRSSVGEKVTPWALAVRRFSASSKRVGCSTGKVAGLTALRILSTKTAAALCCSMMLNEYDIRPPASANSGSPYTVTWRWAFARATMGSVR
jgi:hypothetical protein